MSSNAGLTTGLAPTAAAAASRIVGVKRLTEYLKRKLDSDPSLRIVSVRGEISNVRNVAGGNSYFDLKESDAVLHCFAWASDACRFGVLQHGAAIVASGSVGLYAARGWHQLIVRAIEREGIGDMHLLFEERKKLLAAEGLFAPERKRAMPRFPFRIALVSSRGTNGAHDFETILHERAPHVEVVWCETPVQGPGAPPEICAALARASRADVDLIVVTRGGGSFEDLFAFSDEEVVRAVARARHPVISAIGHTADQQLCDYAADRHVETPTAAAKVVGRDTSEVRALYEDRLSRARTCIALRIERLRGRLTTALVRSKLADPRYVLAPLAQRIDDAGSRLGARSTASLRAREVHLRNAVRRLEPHDPSRRLVQRERRLHAAELGLEVAIKSALGRRGAVSDDAAKRLRRVGPAPAQRAARRLELAQARLRASDPTVILERGYAIVSFAGAIVRDAHKVPAGERIAARLARGTLHARVESAVDGNDPVG